uniref:Uncharacterized protein n=1 Tax=Panagrolaimus sp. ES5 TaxID=591445 RepID=A0AC34G026_9BILA
MSLKRQLNARLLNEQFNNLNLNQNNKCFSTDAVKNATKIDDRKELNFVLSKFSDFTDSQATKNQNDWNKFENEKMPLKCLSIHDEKEKSKEGKLSSANNNSTLSLHIEAYENSTESSNEAEKAGLINHCKNFKPIFSGFAQNPFEFTQKENEMIKPEVMQFKASQSLLNPNSSETYENSNESSNEVEKSGLIQKCKNVKPIFSGFAQNPFEFTQQENEMIKPEVMQFKASQSLLNPNS